MSIPEPPPPHVRATFGLRDSEVEPYGSKWRCGNVVLSPVRDDHARATWSAQVRLDLDVDGVRIARPVRSSDGRWVASGWAADTYLVGAVAARHDEVLATAGRLHAALASLPRPTLLNAASISARVDILGVADRVAWGEELEPFTVAAGAAAALDPPSVGLFRDLARGRRRVQAPPQVVHGNLHGTVLFAGSAEPAITDITPYWHPAPYGAAVAAVDALAWGHADPGLLDRFDDQPEWDQLLLRAVLFRLAVHTMHEHSTPAVHPGLERVAELVRQRV